MTEWLAALFLLIATPTGSAHASAATPGVAATMAPAASTEDSTPPGAKAASTPGGRDAPRSSLRPLLVTIDDLPLWRKGLHPDPAERAAITGDLLRVLRAHHVHAVGFVIQDRMVAGDEALLERWLADGHELGNHMSTHPHLTGTPVERWIADAEAGRVALAKLLARHGKAPRLFRYPFLEEGDTPAKRDAARAYLTRSGQRPVEVTIDDQDWSYEQRWVDARRRDAGAALAEIGAEYQAALRLEVRSQEERGDELLGRAAPQILLLHATEVGAAQWDALFGWLERTDHRFASADEVLADPAFARPPEYVGEYGFGLWDRERAVVAAERAKAGAAALLAEQARAWSAGRIEDFCAVYAEDAVFVGPSGVTRGREQVLARYRAKYPDPRAMGRLDLDVLEARALDGTAITDLDDARPVPPIAVTVVARWTLSYPDRKPATGLTQLVLRRSSGRWEIVSDASM